MLRSYFLLMRFLLMWFLLTAIGVSANDLEPIKPALKPNPSALDKLSNLKVNQAVILGEANVIGDFNAVARRFELEKTGPLGRDYSIKMVWAPERKRAIFTGANHGRPHRLNDVWEFDLGALTWVLLYAPDNPRSYAGLGKDASDVKFEDGVLMTHRGGPAVIGHTWWGITYDIRNRKLLFMNTWDTNQTEAIRQLNGNPAERYVGPPLWTFDPQSQQWHMIKTAQPFPRAPFGGLLEYIAPLEGVIWHTNHWQMLASWLYRPETNKWENLRANKSTGDFSSAAPKTEQVGYYDPVGNRLIVQRGHGTFQFDITKRHWSRILTRPADAEDWPDGHDAFAPMYLDPKTGHGLLVDFRSNKLWAYDPVKNDWSSLTPQGSPMPQGNKRLAYYDIEHGVFVVIDGVVVWAYRYR